MAIAMWLILSVIVGGLAHARGRNPVGWTVLSAFFSPLLAGVLVMALPNPKEEQARREAEMDEFLEAKWSSARPRAPRSDE